MAEVKKGEINQYLTFKLAEEAYAVKVTHIREVLTLSKITKVPRMPEHMMGIINLRGRVVPILDLSRKFGLGETPVTENTGIIVTAVQSPGAEGTSEELTIGILSNEVQKVITIETAEIAPPPKIGVPIDTAFITGIGQFNDNFIIILNIDRILTGNELQELQANAVGA
jgi:purine-binding chemotaxis protein CheW